jgi:hypothetical protein
MPDELCRGEEPDGSGCPCECHDPPRDCPHTDGQYPCVLPVGHYGPHSPIKN